MDKILIRSYKSDDYFSVKDTLIEGKLFDPTWDKKEILEKRIIEKSDSIVVAVVKDEVIGCVYLVDDILPLIFRLSVKEKYRRQGIGRMLVEEAAKRLKRHGHNEIGLFVDNKKEELKNWYRKQGFKETKSLWLGFYKEI